MAWGGVRAELEGDAVRFAADRFLEPLRGASRLPDGWLFVDAAGVVARSESFLGPLERLGDLPRRPAPAPFQRAPGGLCVVDLGGALHLLEGQRPGEGRAPVDGERALGCHTFLGAGPLPARSRVWVDGGRLFALGGGAGPTAIEPPPRALRPRLVRDALVFGELAYGPAGLLEAAPSPEPSPPHEARFATPLAEAWARAEPLHAFTGAGVDAALAEVGDALFDLRRGREVALPEGCSLLDLHPGEARLDCEDPESGDLRVFTTPDGVELQPWPWEPTALPAGPRHALECAGRGIGLRDDLAPCRLRDLAGRDATPAAWDEAPGPIVSVRGTRALALAPSGEEVRRLDPGPEPSPAAAFGSGVEPAGFQGDVDVLALRSRRWLPVALHEEGWRPIPLEPEGATITAGRLLEGGRVLVRTRPLGIGVGTAAGLRWHPAPEGAVHVASPDGRRAIALGRTGAQVWGSATAGGRWERSPLPIDGDPGQLRLEPGGTACGPSGCASGPLVLLWDPPAERLRPRGATLVRRSATAEPPAPAPPEPGLETVECALDATLPASPSGAVPEGCRATTLRGERAVHCFRDGVLEVRVGGGRPVRAPLVAAPIDLRLVFAERRWAVFEGDGRLLVATPRALVPFRVLGRGAALAQLHGRGRARALHVQRGRQLVRVLADGTTHEMPARPFLDPWLHGLTEAGELALGVGDGTLRVFDPATGVERARHRFSPPLGAHPCPAEGARALRLRAPAWGAPRVVVGVGTLSEHRLFGIADLAVVEGRLCFEGLDAAPFLLRFRGDVIEAEAGGEPAQCVARARE
ncbi:MAG TPA: hypothetical protein RMH85_07720 [Polyangiaceae bacterium LLY-WYZ-15_(1-7)]|nr:hypothetical protein [Myxococcales bacterium]MAT28310.1 hypothetical protein [Sandaracinus sp.]HJL05705.1 hypothetical protein [Polyangiaceae bacterium LLY-WYZ-15_(1-7)]HJL08369.1 hypothetical protein [Polyangiaceae bacterium LLY-WYZ-15_(1-7)]HJL26275.1 hypothetical protein [Polyangiaceae bacterium LLY-WYZ-15_(1-7)]